LIEWYNFWTRLTPAITTSYFSSAPEGSNFGVRRGRGGAKERATRRSRDEVECSVKTGIFSEDLDKQEGEETAYAAGNTSNWQYCICLLTYNKDKAGKLHPQKLTAGEPLAMCSGKVEAE
jgi:hypothetical protein